MSTRTSTTTSNWKSVDFRTDLILKLKDAGKNLTPFLHQKEIPYFTESLNEVKILCEVLEKIFLHGIKIKEFQGNIPLWGFLERLEVSNPPSLAVRTTVGAIACVPALRTPSAKARGWIRQCLNSNNLDEVLSFMLTQSPLVSKFYYPEAILLSSDDVSMLIAVIKSLKVCSFNIDLDNSQLNQITPQIQAYLQLQSPVPISTSSKQTPSKKENTPTKSTSSSTGNAPPSSGFDGLFRSFEQNLDKFMNQIDNFIVSKFPSGSSTNQINDDSSVFEDLSGHPKKTTLYNTSLRDLILDENRCSHAYLEPELGIPNQILKLLNYISNNLQTKQLFRTKTTLDGIEKLKHSLELEQGIPVHAHVDIHTVSYVLIEWLNQLPEPLFGHSHYDAFIACLEIEDYNARIRNLQVLCQDIAWYNQPLLINLLNLFQQCLLPENSEINELNAIAISLLATPFLLRPKMDIRYMTSEEKDRFYMTVTATGSSLIQFILLHYQEIFGLLHQQLIVKQTTFSDKCTRIKMMQETMMLSYDLDDFIQEFDEPKLLMIKELFGLLKTAEAWIITAENCVSDTNPILPCASNEEGSIFHYSIDEIINHPRWKTCGFLPDLTDLSITNSSNPYHIHRISSPEEQIRRSLLIDFHASEGFMALKSFISFLKTYKDKGSLMIVEYQQIRHKYCSFPQVIMRICHFVADTLGLLPSSAYANTTIHQVAPLQYLAKQPAWVILGDPECFQSFFNIGILCFEENWNNLTERIGELPTRETFSQVLYKTRSTLWEIVMKRPKTVTSIWEEWINIRLRDEEMLFLRNGPPTIKLSSSSAIVNSAAQNIKVSESDDFEHGINKVSTSNEKNMTVDEIIQQIRLETQDGDFEAPKPDPKSIITSTNTPDAEDRIRSRSNTMTSSNIPLPPSASLSVASSVRHYDQTGEINEALNAAVTAAQEKAELEEIVYKTYMDVTTKVYGGSKILTPEQILQLEEIIPKTHQCYNWNLLYRLSLHGASIRTLLDKAKNHKNLLLVVEDSNQNIFGAFITDKLKDTEKDKYYGNGTMGVFTFNSGHLRYFPWSYKNNYFMLVSKDYLGIGGGGHYALYLDADLNRGTSGKCDTFNSPCLASEEEFTCFSCELFAFESTSVSH